MTGIVDNRVGWLALVGGGEWQPGCAFDAALLEASGAEEVVVLPTAAAFERPDAAVATATRWFSALGVPVRSCPILTRSDAEDQRLVAILRTARFIAVAGGSPMHLRAVLKDSSAWETLVGAWRDGCALSASSAGAMVLGDPMIDPRGGAFTLGLGLLPGLAVLPHADTWGGERMRRTRKLAGAGVALASISERTALLRAPNGTWSVSGHGSVTLHTAGVEHPIATLNQKYADV